MEGAVPVFKQQQQQEQEDTVGGRVVDVVAAFVKRLWRTSYTVLTVDLKRATISYDGPPILSRDVMNNNERGRLRGALVSSTRHSSMLQQQELAREEESGTGWGARLQTSQAQARLKMMQVWDLSKSAQEEWRINLGIGGVFHMDKGQLQPKLRLRAKHASLHLLPEPLVELRGKWPLGRSTDMGLSLRCRLPLSNLDTSWQPRLMLNLFKLGGPSLHLTPAGILLDDNGIELGKYTRLHISAALEFPRELPTKEGEKPFKLDVRRVGLKARTL